MDLTTIQPINLDFYRNEAKIVRAKQYDKNTRYINIKCFDNGTYFPLDKTQMKCNFKMKTPDDRGIYHETAIQDDGSILIELSETSLLVPGMCAAELNIVDLINESLLSTMTFRLFIEQSVYSNDTIIKSNEFNALTKMITEEKSRCDSMKRLEETVSNHEEARISQEDIRIESENGRIAAEEIRKKNEDSRISSETERSDHAADMLSKAAAAIDDANTAASTAINAADIANTKTQEADTVIKTMKTLIKDDNLVHTTDKGVANGVAALDENGNVPSSQLPSYVDDALEGTAVNVQTDELTGMKSAGEFILSGETMACIPESGKIYVDVTENAAYRWSGSLYVSIGSSLTLGTLSSTAFPGNRGLDLENRVETIENTIEDGNSISNTYAKKSELLDLIYPVGAIYMSVNSTNPGTLFGGTWVSWGSGRVPVGINASDSNFSTVEKTGGEKTHALTAAEMPSHTHSLKIKYCGMDTSVDGDSYGLVHAAYVSGIGYGGRAMVTSSSNDTTTNSSGSNSSHNNLQPYITCYMWKRTA